MIPASPIHHPGISVVMSVCDSDRESDLREAILSLFAQTYSDFEVVIVAHGATPELWECMKEFAAGHSGISLIPSAERLTHGVALNLALQASRGKYIVHMDSDDISSPERFEKIEEFFRSHPEVDIVGSFIEEFNPERGTLGVVEYPLGHAEIRKA